MATIADIISSLDITEQQLRSICRFLLKKDDIETLTIGESLVVLVCDFLRQIGLSFEEYLNIGRLFNDDLISHGEDLKKCLDLSKEGKSTPIPWCFFNLIDNRYVGLHRSTLFAIPDLYDLKKEVTVARPAAPPMFTVTVAVDALYMRTLAAKDGYEYAAKCFEKGLLVGKDEAEDRDKGRNS